MKHQPDSPARIDSFAASRGHIWAPDASRSAIAELQRAAKVRQPADEQAERRRFGDEQAHVLLVADPQQPGARDVARRALDEAMDGALNAVPWNPELDVDAEARLRRRLKQLFVDSNRALAPSAPASLTMAFVRWPMLFLVHAGNNRAFLVRDGETFQLTRDHTIAQQMVDAGRIDAPDEYGDELQERCWNGVGGRKPVEPELCDRELQPGDSVVLCSPRLGRALDHETIGEVVRGAADARSACDALLAHASADRGTIAVARLHEQQPQAAHVIDGPRADRGRDRKPRPRTAKAKAVAAVGRRRSANA